MMLIRRGENSEDGIDAKARETPIHIRLMFTYTSILKVYIL
jgi:hypothetical protein